VTVTSSASEGAANTDTVTTPRLSVVIPTYNRADRCQRMLRTLAEQSLDPTTYEVIVVDNGSVDDTMAVLESLVGEFPFRLRPVRVEINRGPGPARNVGWREATAEVIAFTDDDCHPDSGWLEAGLATMRANPRLGVLQGRTRADDIDRLWEDRRNHCVIVDGPGPHFETCNMFYRKQALADGGGFGEDYNWWGGWYAEDTCAGWRSIDAGWERGFTPDAIVTHDVEQRRMKWWITTSLMLCNEVAVAKDHPGYRAEAFWRSWAPRRSDAAFALGVAGAAVATRWRPAALAVLPYLWWRRPSVRQPSFAQRCVETVVIDGARALGIVYGAAKSRTFVI
jgi:glycosyltransferase involved in cell wall biosynthesis